MKKTMFIVFVYLTTIAPHLFSTEETINEKIIPSSASYIEQGALVTGLITAAGGLFCTMRGNEKLGLPWTGIGLALLTGRCILLESRTTEDYKYLAAKHADIVDECSLIKLANTNLTTVVQEHKNIIKEQELELKKQEEKNEKISRTIIDLQKRVDILQAQKATQNSLFSKK